MKILSSVDFFLKVNTVTPIFVMFFNVKVVKREALTKFRLGVKKKQLNMDDPGKHYEKGEVKNFNTLLQLLLLQPH